MVKIDEVRNFWEKEPLFSGESKFEVGSKEFFEEHRRVCLKDGFAGNLRKDIFFPYLPKDARILDLGCGIGFWTVELQIAGGFTNIYAADLTQQALNLTKKRLELYGLTANLSYQNAEKMTYDDGFFSHVNCQGVVHHTPDTEAAISEIARVLKRGGTACISVYYKNFFLRLWPKISIMGEILNNKVRLKGRGRQTLLLQKDCDEIIRMYDGKDNPVGKAYSKSGIVEILEPYFEFIDWRLISFPSRAFPFKLPKILHRILMNHFGFLVHLKLRKR